MSIVLLLSPFGWVFEMGKCIKTHKKKKKKKNIFGWTFFKKLRFEKSHRTRILKLKDVPIFLEHHF